jgi:L-fucose isomerase-like protein
MERVRIGLTGAVHPNMPGDDTGLYGQVIERMTALADSLGFDLSVFREPLRSEDDGRRARDFMDGEKVDLTLLFNASLPFGRVILPLARVKSRLGLWSVPEPVKSGVLQLNSFCGTNMLGSIVGNYLRHHHIKFKWFYGTPGSEMFLERLRVTLRALHALKRLSTARVAQIGGLADGFENLYFDERVLEKRFGTYLQTRYTVEEVVERARRYSERDVAAEVRGLRGEGALDLQVVRPEQVDKSARVFLALRDFSRENGYDALAVSCWSRFQQVYGVAVCAAMSRLNQLGVVTPCEGDVTSAVMMLAMNAMNGSRAALNDLVAFDEEDHSLNLWHCGVAPACWADEAGVTWANHFNIGRYLGDAWKGDGMVASMTFRPGAVTVASLNDEFDNLFLLTGVVMEKKGYAGSSGWVSQLRVNGQPVDVPTLLNTIVVSRVNHHYPTATGDLTSELNELAAWAGMAVLDPVPYRSYLQNPESALRPPSTWPGDP